MNRINAGPESKSGVAAWLMGVALAVAFGVPACTTSTASTSTACSLNSDCAAGLVCALGKCRSQCVNAADCPVRGSSCIDDGRNPVCQPPTEKNTPCAAEADCANPLACASDYRCRNLCASAADCNVLGITGRVCARDLNGVLYCADPNEVTNGAISVAPPPGARTSKPAAEPEGGPGAVVAALPPGDLIATNIGSGGGTIGVPGVTVSVPPGALTGDVTITIKRSATSGPTGTVGDVFEFGPPGTQFMQPITIAFQYTDTELAGLPPSDFAVETSADSGTSWTPLSEIVVDLYAHTIAGQTMHLSPYALVRQGVSVVDAGGVIAANDSGSLPGPSSPDASTVVLSDEGGLSQGDAGAIVGNSCSGRAPDPASPAGRFAMGAGTLPGRNGRNGSVPGVDFSTLVDGYATSSMSGPYYMLQLSLTPYALACGHFASNLYRIGAGTALVTIQSCKPATVGTYGTLQVGAGADGVPANTPSGYCPPTFGTGGGGSCLFPASPTALTITAIDAQHVSGSFAIPQGDAGASITGTFDVPFCTPSTALAACCLP